MRSFHGQFRRVGLACVALGAIAVSQAAFATGTASGTTISNSATVNYSVGSVAQTPINSAAATFVVDNRVNLAITRFGTATTTVAPGQLAQTVVFRVDNLGNTSQGYNFTVVDNASGDTMDMNGEIVRVSSQACTAGSTTPPAAGYQAASDTLAWINSLAQDQCRWVYIVADTPGSATNGLTANMTITATTATANVSGAPTNLTTPPPNTADDKDLVQIVFADPGNNALETATGTYVVSSATLAIVKTSSVVSDLVNGTSFPKAIPGATIEYSIRVTNSGGADATGVSVQDNLTLTGLNFVANAYNAGASNVRITVGGGAATFCNAEAGGTDTNGDGCVRTAGGVLTVGGAALSTVATGGASTEALVSFQMTIP
jgi:uncharacterized repeat protein (TIGR01451 family)